MASRLTRILSYRKRVFGRWRICEQSSVVVGKMITRLSFHEVFFDPWSACVQRLDIRPLWQRKIPKYPLYYKGDPQNRILLPLFWMKMIKPKYEVPPDHVHFKVHPQMSKADIKQYLEKIYDVEVLNVRVEIRPGKIERKRHNAVYKEDEEKLAYVQLKEDTFEFPKLPSETQHHKNIHESEAVMKDAHNEYQTKETHQGLPSWYH